MALQSISVDAVMAVFCSNGQHAGSLQSHCVLYDKVDLPLPWMQVMSALVHDVLPSQVNMVWYAEGAVHILMLLQSYAPQVILTVSKLCGE